MSQSIENKVISRIDQQRPAGNRLAGPIAQRYNAGPHTSRHAGGTQPDTERHDARLPVSGTYGDGNSPENRQGHEGTQRHRTRSARTGRAPCCTPVRVIVGILCPATRHMVC